MGNSVYANGMEVSCKASAGKSICAFPDVCFTPPQTPATPPGVPIPYPNTGMGSDATEGSTSVKISGQEVMLKNKSYFKKSMGDEAGAAPKKGVITSKNTGKVYFKAWSMDVKVEGENVVRHLDITTHNHASEGTNAPPMPHAAMVSPGWDAKNCGEEITKEKAACSEFDPHKEGKSVCKAAGMTADVSDVSPAQHRANALAIQNAPAVGAAKTEKDKAHACLRARRCRLVPYDPKDEMGTKGCCPSQTPDHLLPKSSFFETSVKAGKLKEGWGEYKHGKAPCMCAEGPSNHGIGSHPLRHAHHKAFPPPGKVKHDEMPFADAASHSATGAAEVFGASGCRKSCIEAQLTEQHKEFADDPKKMQKVKYEPSGSSKTQAEVRAEMQPFNPRTPARAAR